MNTREVISEAIIAAGLLCLSAASVWWTYKFNALATVAVVGVNLIVWGLLLLNSNLGDKPVGGDDEGGGWR